MIPVIIEVVWVVAVLLGGCVCIGVSIIEIASRHKPGGNVPTRLLPPLVALGGGILLTFGLAAAQGWKDIDPLYASLICLVFALTAERVDWFLRHRTRIAEG
jgi:hypothetical protein